MEKGFSFRLAALMGLSSAIRSNGLISLGFIFYKCMKIIGKGKQSNDTSIAALTHFKYVAVRKYISVQKLSGFKLIRLAIHIL